MDSGERPPSDDDEARDDERPPGRSSNDTDAEEQSDTVDGDRRSDSVDETSSEPVDETSSEPDDESRSPEETEDGPGFEGGPVPDSTPETEPGFEGESGQMPESGPEPESHPGPTGSSSDESKGVIHRFRHDREGPLMWLREMLSSAAIVLVLGLVLFAVSGVWPPMVAVESGSMDPNMQKGDLVFVTEPGRFAPDAADNDVGVVTYERGQEVDYRTFNSYGSVIIFQPPDRRASPIIHRARFHVEQGENWYDRANDRYHNANDCDDLRHCPAPHDGFITLGDNNGEYDQVNGLAEPVRAEWITGVARLRVPYLGYVRLIVTGQASVGELLPAAVPVEPALPVNPALVDHGIAGVDAEPSSNRASTVAATAHDGDPGVAHEPQASRHATDPTRVAARSVA